jgi:small subunit ribosomal protein S4
MSKRLNSKHKIERRYGVSLWGQAKSPVHVRNYPPGQHGPKGPRKLTEYGQQLAAKQKLKGYYGNITESQFFRTYKEAVRQKGDTGENLLNLLERRLDAVVYRLKFAPTVFCARQLVSHGHIRVNGRRVNISSAQVKDGDEVTLVDSMRSNKIVLSALESSERTVPEYLEYNAKTFTGKFVYRPDSSKIPYPIEMNLHSIIECYAR